MLTVRAGETDEQMLRGIRPLGVTRQRVAVPNSKGSLDRLRPPLERPGQVFLRVIIVDTQIDLGEAHIAIRGVLLIFSGLKIGRGRRIDISLIRRSSSSKSSGQSGSIAGVG